MPQGSGSVNGTQLPCALCQSLFLSLHTIVVIVVVVAPGIWTFVKVVVKIGEMRDRTGCLYESEIARVAHNLCDYRDGTRGSSCSLMAKTHKDPVPAVIDSATSVETLTPTLAYIWESASARLY